VTLPMECDVEVKKKILLLDKCLTEAVSSSSYPN